MMWWDRNTFTKYAEPQQVSKIYRETIALRNRFDRVSNADLRNGSTW